MKFFSPVSEGNIQDHAKTLNQDLINERNEKYQAIRPIIFFAHSLGGLVVKNVSEEKKKPLPSYSEILPIPCKMSSGRF